MAEKTAETDPIVNLISNIWYVMNVPQSLDYDKAKQYVRELWELVMVKGVSRPLTVDFLDRCSEGGFAVHIPPERPQMLNWFIKKAPSEKWAQQAYKFSMAYDDHPAFRMSRAEQPFVYDDGLALYVANFILGMDLDNLFQEAHRHGTKYAPYVEAIAQRVLDDLVFWQTDSPKNMEISRPKPKKIVEDLKSKICLAVENAARFGRVNIGFRERELLNTALGIFDELTLDGTTIVPIVDYCPKNMGLRTESVTPSLDDTLVEICDETGSPSSEGIANVLYHWDPAAKWGHFLEDFFAFFDSYEVGLFADRITPLEERYRTLIAEKQRVGEVFGRWFASSQRTTQMRPLRYDMHLMQFYRATRKSDLSLTTYAWRNETIAQRRKGYAYESTQFLLPKQIEYYSARAIKALEGLLSTFGDGAEEAVPWFRQTGGDVESFQRAYRHCTPENKRVIDTLYLLYIAQRLKNRHIDYDALAAVRNPSQFARPRGR